MLDHAVDFLVSALVKVVAAVGLLENNSWIQFLNFGKLVKTKRIGNLWKLISHACDP